MSRVAVSSSRSGHHRSGFELAVRTDLDRRGVRYDYESVNLEWVEEHIYTPDIVLPNGILVELKGYFDKNDRRKMLHVVKQHDDLDIRIVFQNANAKAAGTKSTCAKWCDRHGIQWASGYIPQEWIDEV